MRKLPALPSLQKNTSDNLCKRPPTRTRSKARKTPKIPMKKHRLTNPRTNKIDEFPLYADKDVGLAEQWIADLQIEARMDDDVDTDDDIY